VARERVRTRLAMLGLGSPDPLPGAAAQARDLALDLSLRSAAGLLGAPLQALLRPVRVTQAWAVDDVDADDDGPDPTGRPSPRRVTFGVIARPTWDRPGTDRPAPGGRLEFSAAVPGASFVGIVDARGWWARGHVRVHRHATLSGDVSATAARVALRTRFGRGIALRADAQYRAQDVEGARPAGEWRLGFAIEAR
jgi:hypothetical protein